MRVGTAVLLFTMAGVSTGRTASITTLASFNGTDGAYPFAGLTINASGDLFGTTENGGSNNDGTVFELVNNGDGNYTTNTLASFSGSNGANLYSSLIADVSGNLFGTTRYGGTNGVGTVFELVNNGGGNYTPATLLNFNAATTGRNPTNGLIADSAGDLFGTAPEGGANGAGTVFELVNNGGGNYTPAILASFSSVGEEQYPYAGLLANASGDLFGTTEEGGSNDNGAVFELVNNGAGSYTPTTLASFTGPNGSLPFTGDLIADREGDLFGTAPGGGAYGGGTVFELVNTGFGGYTPTTLFNFNGTDGSDPNDGLIVDSAGDLFGTTETGGTTGAGTAFELANNGRGNYMLTTLVNFGSGFGATGVYPMSGLTANASGDLFGTTPNGGANSEGTVFEITDSGFITSTENVPEPASIALLGVGLIGLIFCRRRKREKPDFMIRICAEIPRQRSVTLPVL